MEARVFPTARHENGGTLHGPALGRQAEASLRGSSYLALRGVTCESRGGVLYLHGCLPTYYLKQVAQSIASGLDGVGRVVNHIEVLAPPGRSPSGDDRTKGRLGGAV